MENIFFIFYLIEKIEDKLGSCIKNELVHFVLLSTCIIFVPENGMNHK